MKSAEISYDLVMKEQMDFVEGMYRLPNADWCVFATMRCDLSSPSIKCVHWQSGATGLNILVPHSMILNQEKVESLLGQHLDVDGWHVVKGPDSMGFR